MGTRGSQMALLQTGFVIKALEKQNPELSIKVKVITTKGDINDSPIPLDTIGKDWFTKEIEQALLGQDIDFAVHSLKDMAPDSSDGLIAKAVLRRSDPRDALVNKSGKSLKELPAGAIIGTDSIRRKALVLQLRPDLEVRSIRGNVDTRIQKLDSGYDALVLAVAGLNRLNMSDMIAEAFDPAVFVPAPGQGILTIQARQEHTDFWQLVEGIQDANTAAVADMEREFSRVVGGGCKLPVGCHVQFDDDHFSVSGMVGTLDASRIASSSLSCKKELASELVSQLAERLSREVDFSAPKL